MLALPFAHHATNPLTNRLDLDSQSKERARYPVAPGYSKEVLTDLANELGASLGLQENEVFLHEEVVAVNARATPQAMLAENEPVGSGAK